jgi:predicted Zn-dependent peptidase
MPKIQHLKNNLRYITIPVKGTKTVTILVIIGTGSKYENRRNNGISHFLEHMFFKGTIKRPNTLALSSELDSMGAEFNAFTSKEYTGYWIKADAEKLGQAAEIVSDMFLNSKLDQREIEREKGVIIEEMNMYRDNPMHYIEDLFEELLYGDSPAGRDTLGTKENILRFKREDFTKYLRSQYNSQNTIVCIAGNVGITNYPLRRPASLAKRGESFSETSELRITNLLNKYFSKIKKSDFRGKEKVIESQKKPAKKVYFKKTDQAHLSLGVRAYPVGHKYEHILKFISILLGGSMSSRLFIELRERKGLAYYIKTGAELYTDSGYLTTQAGVPVDKVQESAKIILDEYKKLKTNLVPAKELKKIKDLFKGRLALQLEASDDVASWYARQIVLRNKILTPEEYIKKMQSVTAGEIKRVAEEIFVNEKLNFAIIGPYKDLKLEVRI